MPKINEWVIPKNIEKQKLVEEVRELTENPWWQEYQSQVNKSPLSPAAQGKVISKSGSDFVSERGKEGYGPMPFVDEATALIVARADAIMTRLNREYPNVVALFNHNRKGTVEWLKAEGALTGYNVSHYFRVDFTDDTSKNGPKAWARYRDEIEKYVEKLCRDWYDSRGNFQSRLRPARGELATHIHNRYYDKLPYWPSVGETNMASIEVDTGNAYERDSFYIVWSCVGWVSVKDQKPAEYTYMAEFSGNPDTKILQLDFDGLRELNNKVNYWGLSEAKRMIDAKQGTRDPKLLIWEDFK